MEETPDKHLSHPVLLYRALPAAGRSPIFIGYTGTAVQPVRATGIVRSRYIPTATGIRNIRR